MIHIAICEDNKSHLEQISNIVSDICPNAEIAQFYTSEQREELCSQNAPDYDIVLMDIELPKSSGILLRYHRNIVPKFARNFLRWL